MTRGTVRLIAIGSVAWAGAALGLATSAREAPWLALAAGLAALAAMRSARRVAWAVASIGLAAAALASIDIAPPRATTDHVRGRVVALEEAGTGWTMHLDAGRGPPLRVAVPRTGDTRLDTWPRDLGFGAIADVPLKDDPAQPGRRALAASAIVVVERASWWHRLAATPARLAWAFRARARERLVDGEADEVGAFLLASVAGDGRALDGSAWRALRASGLAHIAVVSGFNVSLIALAVAACASPLGGAHDPRRRAAALAAVAMLMLILPADPPVRRAGFALLVAGAGRAAGRGTTPIGALGAAVALLIAMDPRLAASFSFALTVAATAAIVLAVRGRRLRDAVLAFVAPTLATWPLLVTMTGRVSPWTLVANLAASVAIFPSMAAGWIAVLLPLRWTWPLEGATAIARATAWWILAVAHEIARWPRSGGFAAPTGHVWPQVHFALLAAAIALLRGHGPAGAVARRCLAASVALALAASTLWPLRPFGLPAIGRPGLDVLDVGQGEALLLATGDREPVLVDAGDDRTRDGTRALLEQLRARGVTRLSVLAVTHSDRDHSGGAAEVLAAAPPRLLALPGAALDSPALAPLVAEAAERGIPVRSIAAGDVLHAGAVELTVLHPRAGMHGDGNANALVLRARIDGLSMLLPSDVDEAVERDLALRGLLPPTDLLVAGHHGSRTCTSAALLARIAPRLVLISCGAGNRYGHPHPEVIARLGGSRIAWIATDRAGPVSVRARGERRLEARGNDGPLRVVPRQRPESGTGMKQSTRIRSAAAASR